MEEIQLDKRERSVAGRVNEETKHTFSVVLERCRCRDGLVSTKRLIKPGKEREGQ